MGKQNHFDRIMFIDREVVAVVFVQADAGAEPEKALQVLHDGTNGEMRKTLLDGAVVETQVA